MSLSNVLSLQDCWAGMYSLGYICPVILLIVPYSDRRVSTRQPTLCRDGTDIWRGRAGRMNVNTK